MKLKRILKILLRTVVAVAVTFAVLVSIAVAVLTPDRLTSLINKYGAESFAEGRVSVSRAELTLWKTFPRLELTVDSLAVTALNMPDSVATPFAVERFKGSVGLLRLLGGTIALHNVTITRPCVNIFTAADGRSNIGFLASEPDTVKSDEPLSLPDIVIDRFRIEGDAPIAFTSEPDSLWLRANIGHIGLDKTNPHYLLAAETRVASSLFTLPPDFAIGLDGKIHWRHTEPLNLDLSDFKLNVGELQFDFNLLADLQQEVVKRFEVYAKPIALTYLLGLARLQPGLEDLPIVDTPAKLRFSASITEPYSLADTLMPGVSCHLKIGEAPLSVPSMKLDLKRFELDADALTSPAGLDSAHVWIKKFVITGGHEATDLSLTAHATNLASDPFIEGIFDGQIEIGKLPPALFKALAFTASGRFSAKTYFEAHLSDLSANTFHRARLNGGAHLTDLRFASPADILSAYVHLAELQFGTSQKFVRDGHRADSLLTLSLKLDTASVTTADLDGAFRDLRLGFGCRGDVSLTDTTVITPMGGLIEARNVKIDMPGDSVRASLRSVRANAYIKRFASNKKVPEFAVNFDADRAVYAQSLTRVSLGRTHVDGKFHITPKAKRATASRRDSVKRFKSEEPALIELDRATGSLLRRLEMEGSLTSSSGRVFTPMFPLRIRMKDLDFSFTSDSIALKSLELKAGQSRFHANGSVADIRQSVLQRRQRTPLKVRFNLKADTININELTQAAFRGAAFMAAADSTAMAALGSLDLDDTQLQETTDSMAVSDIAAVIVPDNIDANLSFRADNIIYSGIMMRDFHGDLIIRDSAVNLNNLGANTDVGSADLNALYYAPSKDDIDFAMGLKLNRFRLDRVIELIPSLDSIMPILSNIGGVVDVGMGVTSSLDSAMNLNLPSLKAMMKMTGDSLVVLDEQTYKTMSKWLLFRDKKHNLIDHMEVELAVENSMLQLYPFVFDFDRYRLGVMGHNDLDMNLDYHVSVLKSPIPFKFGINIKGNVDKMKIRLGRAKLNEKNLARQVALPADSVRINLVREMRSAFTRGLKAARVAPLHIERPTEIIDTLSEEADTLTADQLNQMTLM